MAWHNGASVRVAPVLRWNGHTDGWRPLGLQLFTDATVCADPISWFQDAGLISNPSVFVLGLPGLGKSALVRRMAAGGAGLGALPLILGDLKPYYVDMICALGGQVITLGRGPGT